MSTLEVQPLRSANNQHDYVSITDSTDPISKKSTCFDLNKCSESVQYIGAFIFFLVSAAISAPILLTVPPCIYIKGGPSCDWDFHVNNIFVIIFIIFVGIVLLINNICWIKQKNKKKHPLSPKYHLFIWINIISVFTIYFSIFNDIPATLLLCPVSICCLSMFFLYITNRSPELNYFGLYLSNEAIIKIYRLSMYIMIFFIIILIIVHCWYVFGKVYDVNIVKYRAGIMGILNLTLCFITIVCLIIIVCRNKNKSRTESIEDEITDISTPSKEPISVEIKQYITKITKLCIFCIICSCNLMLIIYIFLSLSGVSDADIVVYDQCFPWWYIPFSLLLYFIYKRHVVDIDDDDNVAHDGNYQLSWICGYCQEERELDYEQCKICGFKRETVTVSDQKQNELKDKIECNCVDGEMDLNECCSWIRIKTISEQFINDESADLDKNVYAIYCSITNLLDDYHHIILKHNINDINQCDITKCKCTKYIDRDDTNKNNKQFKTLLLSTMKEMHCFIYHNINRHSQKRRFVKIITSTSNKQPIVEEEKVMEEEDEKEQKLEDLEETDEKNEFSTYGYGVFMQYTKYQSTFNSLKEEMLNNKIFPNDLFGIDDSQKIYEASLAKLKTAEGRKSRLMIGQMIAIKMYTDLNSAQYYFRKSFRRSNEYQSNDDIAFEHCVNFYHWGTNLQNAIYRHGNNLQSTNEKKYYHGLSEPFIFPSLRKDFNIPTSLTTNLIKAQGFASYDGIVLELISGWSLKYENKTKLFPVEWISQFADEQESLLFGNHNKLIIYDIIPQNKLNINPHKKYIKAIYNFEALCDGEIHDDNTKYLADLIELIQNKLNHRNQNSYIAQVFTNICKKRQYFAIDSIIQNIEISSAFKNIDLNQINIHSLECCDRNCGKTLIKTSNLKDKYKCYGCDESADIVCGRYLIGCEYALCLKCSKIVSIFNRILIKAKHKKKSMMIDEDALQKEQQEKQYEMILEQQEKQHEMLLILEEQKIKQQETREERLSGMRYQYQKLLYI